MTRSLAIHLPRFADMPGQARCGAITGRIATNPLNRDLATCPRCLELDKHDRLLRVRATLESAS